MKKQTNTKGSVGMWVPVLIVIILIILGIMQGVKNSNKSTGLDTNTPVLSLEVNEADWIKGDINSPVVIVEYADFQCPACGAYHSIVKALEEKFEGQVAFVFRHFPLTQIHPNALLASVAAESAGLQGKFWEMHDMIFENQEAWSGANKAQDIFTEYANTLELDIDQFTEGLADKAIAQKVSDHYKDGAKFGVNSTPSFFINGKKIKNSNYQEFEDLITSELSI